MKIVVFIVFPVAWPDLNRLIVLLDKLIASAISTHLGEPEYSVLRSNKTVRVSYKLVTNGKILCICRLIIAKIFTSEVECRSLVQAAASPLIPPHCNGSACCKAFFPLMTHTHIDINYDEDDDNKSAQLLCSLGHALLIKCLVNISSYDGLHLSPRFAKIVLQIVSPD